MQIKDIMTKDVIAISPETLITEVADIMSKNRFHGVPVIEKGELVGIVTETDFYIRGTNISLPSFATFLEDIDTLEVKDFEKRRFLKKVVRAKAKDIMTSLCVTVPETMNLSELLSFYQKTEYHTLPVVNDQSKMVGIVTRSDLIHLLSISS
jgi:CBS domain-containing protein